MLLVIGVVRDGIFLADIDDRLGVVQRDDRGIRDDLGQVLSLQRAENDLEGVGTEDRRSHALKGSSIVVGAVRCIVYLVEIVRIGGVCERGQVRHHCVGRPQRVAIRGGEILARTLGVRVVGVRRERTRTEAVATQRTPVNSNILEIIGGDLDKFRFNHHLLGGLVELRDDRPDPVQS